MENNPAYYLESIPEAVAFLSPDGHVLDGRTLLVSDTKQQISFSIGTYLPDLLPEPGRSALSDFILRIAHEKSDFHSLHLPHQALMFQTVVNSLGELEGIVVRRSASEPSVPFSRGNATENEEGYDPENYLRTIFNNTDAGYIFLDANGLVLSFNQRAADMARSLNNKSIVAGGDILSFVAEERFENFREVLQSVLEGNKLEYERGTNNSHHEDEWYFIRLSPVTNRNNRVVNVIMSLEDITERKRNEIQLNKSLDLVIAQNKRLLSFSYIVSHNLRSHSANIASLVSFIAEAESEAEQKEMIDHLKDVSKSLDDTLANLNDIISIHTSINPIFEPLLVSAFLKKATEVLREQIYRKNASIINRIDKNTVLNYNPAYLESIMLNFLSNAIKYGHPDRDPKIIVDFIADNGKQTLIFEDNGIGIDLKKNGDKLFGLYKTFNGNPDARGLGLFITKNQIEFMGGSIEVASEIGLGTIFKIHF